MVFNKQRDKQMSKVQQDFRVTLDMSYLGLDVIVSTNNSTVMAYVKCNKNINKKKQKQLFETIQGLLQIQDKVFSTLREEGLDYTKCSIMVGGRKTTWAEFCDDCVFYATLNLSLNKSPLHIVKNAHKLQSYTSTKVASKEDEDALINSGLLQPQTH